VTKVRSWDIVEHPTDVASPSSSIINPRHEGVDVGSASLAADDSSGTKVNNFNEIIVSPNVTGHWTANNSERNSRLGGKSLGIHNLANTCTEEGRVALDGEVHLFDAREDLRSVGSVRIHGTSWLLWLPVGSRIEADWHASHVVLRSTEPIWIILKPKPRSAWLRKLSLTRWGVELSLS
jgi:hypothetical protein